MQPNGCKYFIRLQLFLIFQRRILYHYVLWKCKVYEIDVRRFLFLSHTILWPIKICQLSTTTHDLCISVWLWEIRDLWIEIATDWLRNHPNSIARKASAITLHNVCLLFRRDVEHVRHYFYETKEHLFSKNLLLT